MSVLWNQSHSTANLLTSAIFKNSRNFPEKAHLFYLKTQLLNVLLNLTIFPVFLHLKLYMILQNTLNYLHDFRKLIKNCSRTEIYLWPWYLWSFFYEIYTISRWFSLFFAKFLLLLSAKFSKFPGYYMYLLTQLSIFNAVQNPKQIRQTEKIFECWKFFGSNNRSGTSANKKYDRKALYNFMIFCRKKT